MDEVQGLIKQLDTSYNISTDLFAITTTTLLRDVPLLVEMRFRFLLRTLTWDLVGDDYAERANWIWTTVKYFRLDKRKPRNLAIFFLSVFGFACEDQKDHYENSNSLSFYQCSILEDLHNHTDWDYFTDSFPIDFRDGKRTFLTLAQARNPLHLSLFYSRFIAISLLEY